MSQTIKIPKRINNREFTAKVLANGVIITEDEFGRKFVGAFDKTYYVEDDHCCKMTPEQWIQSHEDFRND